MHRSRTQELLLWIAATDSSFELVELRDGPGLGGKCIHCNAKHYLTLGGQPISRPTIEHIVPQCHGGTEDLTNLAIACGRCNGGKGIRHDNKPLTDPKLQAMIELLQKRRAARMRPPLEGLSLPPWRESQKRDKELPAGKKRRQRSK